MRGDLDRDWVFRRKMIILLIMGRDGRGLVRGSGEVEIVHLARTDCLVRILFAEDLS